MQDQRVRLGATLILSWAAYSSMLTAALVLAWWLLFTRSWHALPKRGVIIAMGTMVVLSAVVTQFSGGDGGSYLLRITVVLLIASWAYSERIEGEMIDLAVWLFGRHLGFDIGLIAEIAIQSLEVANQDLRRIRVALALKGKGTGLRSLLLIGTLLVHTQLDRSRDLATLLALRGYVGGGSLCPAFKTARSDLLPAITAILIGLLVIVPVRDVFILLQ
jgi:hypothetical protein